MCIIRNDAESRICSIFLHDSPQRHLRSRGHSVCLVQDDELVSRDGGSRVGGRVQGKDLFRAGEGFDLFADDVNTAVVRCVEFEDHLPHVFGAVDPAGEGEDCRRFPCSRRAVEEEMGQPLWRVSRSYQETRNSYVCVYKLVDCC